MYAEEERETLLNAGTLFLEIALVKAGSSHFIITQSETFGPLTTEEVFKIFENDKDLLIRVKWIAPSGQMPVLLSEWLDDFQSELENISNASQGLLQSSDKPLSIAGLSDSGLSTVQRKATFGKPDGFTVRRPKFTRLREIAAFFGLGLLGGVILYTGIRSMRPLQSYRESGKSVQARLLTATPDALKTYRQLLEAKILRDPVKYSQVLLHMFRDRELYPPGLLPSLEFFAAQALVHLDAKDLDQKADWKELLKTLPAASRQNGLAVVAYELSRVKAAREDLLKKHKNKKIRQETVASVLDEIGIVLERLTRVVVANDTDNGVVHALYLAKALTLSLVTASENFKEAKQVPLITESLKKIPALYPFMKTVDKEVVETLRSYFAAKLTADNGSKVIPVPLGRLWTLHSESQYLCQLNDYGAATDTILYLLSEASRTKQKLPSLGGLFDGCFVGLRSYTNAAVTSFTEESPLNVGFVKIYAPDRGLLNEFRVRYPTMNQAVLRAKGQTTATGDWLLALHFNDILGSQLKLSHGFSSAGRKCGKASLDSGVCLQTLWYENRRHWRDFIPFLGEAQDYVRPEELSLLVQRFTLDAAKGIISGNSQKKSRELAELIASLKAFGISEDPELQIVLDYARSLEDAS